MTKNKGKGFTLIELMVVVSMIGILASIAIPSFQGYLVRAQIAEGMSLAGGIHKEIKAYYQYKGSFPKDNKAAGVPEAKYLIGNYVKRIEVSDGAVHILFGNKVNKGIDGKTLSIRPLVVKGSPASPISWNCGMAEPPEGMMAVGENRTDMAREFLPGRCRGA